MFAGALIWTGTHARDVDRKTQDVRAHCDFLRDALRRVPEDAVVITADPPVVLAEGRSAAFLPWVWAAPARAEQLAAIHAGGLYYYTSPSSRADYWPDGAQSESWLRERYELATIATRQDEHGPCCLYRLHEKASTPAALAGGNQWRERG